MPRSSRLIALAVFTCFILLISIKETFFYTITVSNTEKVETEGAATAKRVVLVVVDGLRSDIAFQGWDENKDILMPYLKSKLDLREDSLCATSLTQAPTESRACHTAMLAGYFEDMANLRTLWKKNAHPIEHVLTKASYSYAFGGPDVVDFIDGPSVVTKSFDHGLYRSISDTSDLDQWTLDEYRKVLEDPNDASKIEANSVIFFLHLAGVDTAGHRYGAHSEQYSFNARKVDEILADIEIETNLRFPDNSTSFIFTSDHGFPDNGSHGSDDINTIQCPLVIWGTPLFLQGGQRLECGENVIDQRSIHTIISFILAIPFAGNNRAVVPQQIIRETMRAPFVKANSRQLASLLAKKLDLWKHRSVVVSLLSFFKVFEVSLDSEIEYGESDALASNSTKKLITLIERLEMFLPLVIDFVSLFTGIFLLNFEHSVNTSPTSTPFVPTVSGVLIGYLIDKSIVAVGSFFCLFLLSYFSIPCLKACRFSWTSVIHYIWISIISLSVYLGMYSSLWLVLSSALCALPLISRSTLPSVVTSIFTQSTMIATGNTSILTPLTISVIIAYLLKRSCASHGYKAVLDTALIAAVMLIKIADCKYGTLTCFALIVLRVLNETSSENTSDSRVLTWTIHCLCLFGVIHDVIYFFSAYLLCKVLSEQRNAVHVENEIRDNVTQNALTIFILSISSIMSPAGIHSEGTFVWETYTSLFGIPKIVLFVISKGIVMIGVLWMSEMEFNSGLFLKSVSIGIILSSLVSLKMRPNQSWLKIGLDLTRFVICLTLPLVIGVLGAAVQAVSQRVRTFTKIV